ncbi:MAG: 2,3-bisphosphoglycerate-independent phosphoglycerate mutase [Candidatus Niyogibacteria bacterium]|nr:2,3-bisphosphoglycerate-independent phosphoglycerate mutase [Candidatus Niyogibacteria bacterium]
MSGKASYHSLKIPYKPLVFIVLDGFGVSSEVVATTWSHAKRPTFEEIENHYPFTTLQASGVSVGLMYGEAGNSEVGHLTIGSGRIVYSHLPRIIVAIQDGSFFSNPAFKKAATHARTHQSNLHIMGLLSSGSVHAYIDHFYAILDFCKHEHVERVFLHIFTDGRDGPPKEGVHLIEHLEERISKDYPFARVASLIGRRFAMDRDDYWDRIETTYNLLVDGGGETFEDSSAFIRKNYEIGITDEYIPAGIKQMKGSKTGTMQDNDAVIFLNYREDSARELTSAFTDQGFDKFGRRLLRNLFFVTMTEYDARFPVAVAFPPITIEHPLSRVISDGGFSQLHIAETEKYAHVTYFFNGGIEKMFPGEARELVPSPKNIRFDEKPEMAAADVTDAILDGMQNYDFVLANFANADMVGHTGNLKATVKAVEILDYSLGIIIPKVLEQGGGVVITSDHGNAEEKLYFPSGEKRTSHTTNPVPFYLVLNEVKRDRPRTPVEIKALYSATEGVLSDIAPTLLELMDLSMPSEMTGISLLPRLLK